MGVKNDLDELEMFKKVRKDKKIRKEFFLQEQRHVVLKSLSENGNFSTLIQWNAGFSLLSPSITRKTKLVNRCILTGRNSKIHSYYRVSRLSFLNFVRSTMIPGVFKSS